MLKGILKKEKHLFMANLSLHSKFNADLNCIVTAGVFRIQLRFSFVFHTAGGTDSV